MIARLQLAWRRFWLARDRDRDAGYIKAAIKDAQRRHAPTEYLWEALRDLRHEQLRGAR